MLAVTVKNYFQNKHIPLDDNFLQQVLEWTQDTYPNAPDDEIFSKVFAEWINMDMCDVKISVLPHNISETINTTINNIIYLQLLHVVDISKPKYLQLKSIRSRFDDHTEDVESCGMLRLQLTDGVQQVAAIEYKKVPCLNINLSPGLKVMFKPPINIRRGQILLEPGMIELIGGCVPEIEVTNCVENVLAAALKQPLNTNPKNKPIANVPVVQVPDSQRSSVTLTNITTTNSVHIPRDEPTVPSHLNTPDEFDAICNDAFFDSHFKANNIRPTPPPTIPPVQDLTDLEDEILAQRDEEMTPIATTPVASGSVVRPYISRKKNISVDAIFSPVSRPVITIEKLNSIRGKVTKGMFKIKMEILEVRQKLQVLNNKYSMTVLAADDSGEIEVQLDHKVMIDLIRVNTEALQKIWSSGEQCDQEKLQTIMNNLTEAINTFYAHVTLVLEANSVPVVTEVLETFPLPV